MLHKQKIVLIVEDDKMVAEICAKHLTLKGYRTVLAFDGLQALEKLEQVVPDLILLDLEMPEMDGIEFYHHICNDRGFPKFPVLILTGQVDFENSFKEVKVDGFMSKPFSINVLLDEVENILENQYWRRNNKEDQKVIIVDKDSTSLYKIAEVFSKANFHVDITESGISAMERIMRDPPSVVLINVNLKDIAGELVILRMQRMLKTKDVKYILYESKSSEPSKDKTVFRYADPQDLLLEVKSVLSVESKVLHLN